MSSLTWHRSQAPRTEHTLILTKTLPARSKGDYTLATTLTLTLGNPNLKAQAESWAYISPGILCRLLTTSRLGSGMGVRGSGSLSLYVCLLILTLGDPNFYAQAEAWPYISQGTHCWLPTTLPLQSGTGPWHPGLNLPLS